jgi:hypothetical protein
MRWVVVLLVLSGLACVSYKRVTIGPGNATGDVCLQTCKQPNHSDDAIVECASKCPGAVVQDDDCHRPVGADGEYEPVTGCVATMHVRWGRIATIGAVIVGAALLITVLGTLAFLSAPTH